MLFDAVAKNAFPDTSSPLSATVLLMLATTIILIGGTGFAASKTYSTTAKSKGEISSERRRVRENKVVTVPKVLVSILAPYTVIFLTERTCPL